MVKKYMDIIEEKYQQTLDYLYGFVDFSLTRQDRLAAANFDLQRMLDLMEILGNPHQAYPVIHIAGTKGKGSTAAMTASILQQAGYHVGLYTSPHLQDYCERIQIDHKNISHEYMVELVEKLKPAIAKVSGLTTFEITTALGFMAFAESQVDIAVVEVGLGGRLDATNIVTPLVSVITSLSYDHMNVLGNTLSQIAGEKGGIIKKERPVIVAPQEDSARQVIERIAAERYAPLIQVGRDILFTSAEHSLDQQTLLIWASSDQEKMNCFLEGMESSWQPEKIAIPLLGYHQIQNAVTAYTVIQQVRAQGFEISEQAVQTGFASVKWPGRFEILHKDPILVVDSAHNLDSALKLRLTIDDYLGCRSVILLFGVSEDKDITGMFTQLMPRVKKVIATQSTHPRAYSAEKLVELAHQFGRSAVAIPDIAAALQEAMIEADHETAVVVAGSIFVAAAVREEWPGVQKKLLDYHST
jgi:dihydrofolate synthase/folylpolyglutamate synthase